MSQAKRIAALSVSAPELEQIRQLLERVRTRLGSTWQWSGEADADVLLIDVDSVYGHMDWLRAHAAGRHIISLTNRPSAEDEAVLRRPITADGLCTALRPFDGTASNTPASRSGPTVSEVAGPDAAMRAAVTPNTAAAPTDSPNAVATKSATNRGPEPARSASPSTAAAEARPPAAERRTAPPTATSTSSPEPSASAAAPPPAEAPRPATLADYLNPTALPSPARLVRGDTPALTVDAANDCWYGPTSLKALLPYCTGPIAAHEWKPVSAAVMDGLRAAGGAQPIARLLWLIALANSNGQLSPALSPNARYRLARWPQIEREFPKHFRIATVMMKGWATLTEISEQAGATLAEVIDLVNAYVVSGHAESEAEPTAAAPAAATPRTPMARLGNLLRRPSSG